MLFPFEEMSRLRSPQTLFRLQSAARAVVMRVLFATSQSDPRISVEGFLSTPPLTVLDGKAYEELGKRRGSKCLNRAVQRRLGKF